MPHYWPASGSVESGAKVNQKGRGRDYFRGRLVSLAGCLVQSASYSHCTRVTGLGDAILIQWHRKHDILLNKHRGKHSQTPAHLYKYVKTGRKANVKLTVFAKQRHKHNADRPRAAVNGGGWLVLVLY